MYTFSTYNIKNKKLQLKGVRKYSHREQVRKEYMKTIYIKKRILLFFVDGILSKKSILEIHDKYNLYAYHINVLLH